MPCPCGRLADAGGTKAGRVTKAGSSVDVTKVAKGTKVTKAGQPLAYAA